MKIVEDYVQRKVDERTEKFVINLGKKVFQLRKLQKPLKLV